MDWPELIELIQRYAPDCLLGVGSLVLVASNWWAHRRLSEDVGSWEGDRAYIEQIRSTVSDQLRHQLIGFALLALGFAMKLFWSP